MNSNISIIVPTYNESSNIKKLLKEIRLNIKSQIIIVDDSNNNLTKNLLKKEKMKIIYIKRMKKPAPLPVRIVIFGDSISAYRDNLNVASLQLSEKLKSEGIPFVFINSGVRGNTTEMGRARFQEDVLNHSPDVVIMAFGTNDAAVDVYLGKSDPRVTLERYSENLAFFLSELTADDLSIKCF